MNNLDTLRKSANKPTGQIYFAYALTSALALLLGLDPYRCWLISWLAFVPLFLIAVDPPARLRDKTLYPLVTGLIGFGYGLFWITYYEPEIYVLTVAVTAPTFALYFLLLHFLAQNKASEAPKPAFFILTAGFLWIFLQTLYTWTPISTMATEVPFYGPKAFFQIVPVTGFLPMGGLVMALAASLAMVIQRRSRTALLFLCLLGLVLTGIWFYGENRLAAAGGQSFKESHQPSLKVALIQHNLPVDLEWNLTHPEEIQDTYRQMALEAAGQSPQLIIFPLYDFGKDVLRTPDFFVQLAQETRAYLLIATYIPNADRSGFYDMSILYAPDGNIESSYHAFMAPPFREITEITAERYKIMETGIGKLGVHLCYESGLSRLTSKAVNEGAELLIALSNPGHFNRSHLPYYHLMQDRLRALESNRYMIRAAANGYSGLIDPRGKVLVRSELNTRQILYFEAPLLKEKSLYHTLPPIVPIAAAVWIGFTLLAIKKKKTSA